MRSAGMLASAICLTVVVGMIVALAYYLQPILSTLSLR